MKRTNLLIIIVASICIGLGYFSGRRTCDSIGTNLKIIAENDSLRHLVDTKDSTIFELECQNEILDNDAQRYEEKISYWSSKYDSLRAKNWP